MRLKVLSIILCLLIPLGAAAQKGAMYSWVDDEGIRHYGDKIPVEFADKPKQVVNEHGVTVGHIEGKKTVEQIEAERVAKELQVQKELQRRADLALLSTYVNITEIEMHRDRRVELFQAQARVTELYLRNLHRRLSQLKGEAGRYKPYSSDPDAEMIDPSLVDEIQQTEGTITRHKGNLEKYHSEEDKIIERFEGDIQRFTILKGLTHAQTVPE
jgi:hypothetical protein